MCVIFSSAGSCFRSSDIPPRIWESFLSVLLWCGGGAIQYGPLQYGVDMYAGNNGRVSICFLPSLVEI